MEQKLDLRKPPHLNAICYRAAVFTTDVRNGKLQSASGGAPNAVRDRTFAVPNWCTESVVEWVSKQERKTGCKVQSETLNGRYVGGPTRFPPRRMVSQASAMDNSCDVKKYLRPAFDHIFVNGSLLWDTRLMPTDTPGGTR